MFHFLKISLFLQALVYCVESYYFAITWGLHFLGNNCEQQNQEENLIGLQRNLFKFMNVCTELVRSSRVIEIQEAVSIVFLFKSLSTLFHYLLLQAFKSICDLLIIFSDQLGLVNPLFKRLHYVSTSDQQSVLNGFVQQSVFAVQEEG